MSSLKHPMTNRKLWILSENGNVLVMILAGAFFIALGIHRFCLRSEHLRLWDLLGCVVGAFGGFFLLLIADYLLHHARLALIPWITFLLALAFTEPHAAVGLGLALWYMLGSQFTSRLSS
jgi:hypothetical protein